MKNSSAISNFIKTVGWIAWVGYIIAATINAGDRRYALAALDMTWVIMLWLVLTYKRS